MRYNSELLLNYYIYSLKRHYQSPPCKFFWNLFQTDLGLLGSCSSVASRSLGGRAISSYAGRISIKIDFPAEDVTFKRRVMFLSAFGGESTFTRCWRLIRVPM